METWSAA